MKSDYRLNNEVKTDQDKKLPQPPLEKSFSLDATIVELPKVDKSIIVKSDLYSCILERRTRRKYSDESLSLKELSFLLWTAQGVSKVIGNNSALLRTVPSGGKVNGFETYLIVNNVEGLKNGVYRYLSLSHQLLFIHDNKDTLVKLDQAIIKQSFIIKGAVIFVWNCIPYRSEWRSNIVSRHKSMLIDAGHVCQNLYLACEAIGCGTCAIAAYDQVVIDNLLEIDGDDEFVIYLAPVGKIPK